MLSNFESGPTFFEFRRSKRLVLMILIRLFPSDQNHAPRNCLKFADTKNRVLKVDSGEENKEIDHFLPNLKKNTTFWFIKKIQNYIVNLNY